MAENHSTRTCSVNGCDRSVAAKGLCGRHYGRVKKTGTVHRICARCSKEISGEPQGRVVFCSDHCRTCEVKSCSNEIYAKTLCKLHYSRKHQGWDLEKSCESCGEPLSGNASKCESCKESMTCKVEGCDGKVCGRGWCNTHYGRWFRHGTPYRKCKTCGTMLDRVPGKTIYCSEDCVPRCIVPECERPKRSGRGHCDKHNALFRLNGDIESSRSWVEKSEKYQCLSCGVKFSRDKGSRRFCTGRCQALYSQNEGEIPDPSFNCGKCGIYVNRAWRKDFNIRLFRQYCDACQQRDCRDHKYFKDELVAQGQADCGICGGAIDIGLEYPHKESLTVDHILPASLGGDSRRENLRAAHLSCNSRRGNRVDVPTQIALPLVI